MNKEIYTKLVSILSELTGNQLTEITPDSHLQDDLGLDLEVGFARLINAINDSFTQSGDELDLDPGETLEILADYEITVSELAKIIEEELALG